MSRHLNNVISLLWAGMIIGVSLIATPIKFNAPLLDLPTALDVGRVTFTMFNTVEWGVLMLLLILLLLNKSGIYSLALLAVCLLLQTFWLLPVLNARVMVIIQGNAVPSSFHHGFYGFIEVLKIVVLIYRYRFSAKSFCLRRTLT